MGAGRHAEAAEEEHLGAGLLGDARGEGVVGHDRAHEPGPGQHRAQARGRRHRAGPAIRQAFSTIRSMCASWKIGKVS